MAEVLDNVKCKMAKVCCSSIAVVLSETCTTTNPRPPARPKCLKVGFQHSHRLEHSRQSILPSQTSSSKCDGSLMHLKTLADVANLLTASIRQRCIQDPTVKACTSSASSGEPERRTSRRLKPSLVARRRPRGRLSHNAGDFHPNRQRSGSRRCGSYHILDSRAQHFPSNFSSLVFRASCFEGGMKTRTANDNRACGKVAPMAPPSLPHLHGQGRFGMVWLALQGKSQLRCSSHLSGPCSTNPAFGASAAPAT